MNIFEKLDKIMKEKGITAYKLEKDLGIKQTTFQNWKRGSKPPAETIREIILYLKVSADEFYETNYSHEQDLTENEKEMLELFQKLSDREQIKEIGRLEDRVKQLNEMEGSSNSENDKAG